MKKPTMIVIMITIILSMIVGCVDDFHRGYTGLEKIYESYDLAIDADNKLTGLYEIRCYNHTSDGIFNTVQYIFRVFEYVERFTPSWTNSF